MLMPKTQKHQHVNNCDILNVTHENHTIAKEVIKNIFLLLVFLQKA
jgi:hypothetical protein